MRRIPLNRSGQIIIVNQPGFRWNKRFSFLNHHLLKAQVVFSIAMSLKRPVLSFPRDVDVGNRPRQRSRSAASAVIDRWQVIKQSFKGLLPGLKSNRDTDKNSVELKGDTFVQSKIFFVFTLDFGGLTLFIILLDSCFGYYCTILIHFEQHDSKLESFPTILVVSRVIKPIN